MRPTLLLSFLALSVSTAFSSSNPSVEERSTADVAPRARHGAPATVGTSPFSHFRNRERRTLPITVISDEDEEGNGDEEEESIVEGVLVKRGGQSKAAKARKLAKQRKAAKARKAAAQKQKASQVALLKGTHAGDGTFFGVGLGACGHENTDKDYIVAVSHLLYDSFPGATPNPNNNPICARRIRASIGGHSVVVKIVDRCVGCKKFDLDFSPAAFKKLASFDKGRLHNVKWTFV